MGITIDETISEFEILKKYTFGYMRANQAFIKAIDTMRKYQKIEQIIKEWNLDDLDYDGHYAEDYLSKIEELIKEKEEE